MQRTTRPVVYSCQAIMSLQLSLSRIAAVIISDLMGSVFSDGSLFLTFDVRELVLLWYLPQQCVETFHTFSILQALHWACSPVVATFVIRPNPGTVDQIWQLIDLDVKIGKIPSNVVDNGCLHCAWVLDTNGPSLSQPSHKYRS